MRRRLTIAACALALAALTACGPAGSLGAPTGVPQPSETGAATEPPSTPAPTTAGTAPPTEAPPATAAPPIVQPSQVPLPELPPPPRSELPLEGAAAAPGERFDIAIACSPPVGIVLDGDGVIEVGDAEGTVDPDGGWIWCSEGDAIALHYGVPGEHARAWAVVEDDLGPPLGFRLPAGTAFGADTVARLAAAAGLTTVRVEVQCGEPAQLQLDDEQLWCEPGLWGSGSFQHLVPVESAFSALTLPGGFTGSVYLHAA